MSEKDKATERFKILLFFGVLLGCPVIWYAWMIRPRRPSEPGYEYIMVNDDGSARELTQDERECLEGDYHPADGARPDIKFRYKSKNGWGSIRGYLSRRQLPRDVVILPEPESSKLGELDIVEAHREAGDTVTIEPDDSVSASPDPNISPDERVRRFKRAMDQQIAEQDGARRPATAPESESEGKDERKPDSKGRSQ